MKRGNSFQALFGATLGALMLVGSIPFAALAADVELTFWSWRTEDREAYNQFIEVFETRNPDIDVQFIAYKNTEYNTILSTALQGGAGPDIIQLRAYGGMEPLANAGYLVPLDGVVPELDGFSPTMLQGATNRSDGRVYGVPFAVQTVEVLYNKAIFRQLGLEVPDTWDEFLNVAQQVKDAGYIPFANGGKEGWTLETFFGAVAPNFYGGSAYYNDLMSGERTFEDPAFKNALNHMLELRPYLPEGYMGVGYTDMQVLFANEVAAMFLAGSYELGTLANMNPNLEVGAFLVPGEEASDPVYMSAYVDGSYGINADTDHRDAAVKFVRFLATQEFGQMFTDELKQISAVPGTSPSDPTLANIVELMEGHDTPYMMVAGFRFDEPSGSTLLQNNLQGLFGDNITVDEAAAAIQKGIAIWHEPFQD